MGTEKLVDGLAGAYGGGLLDNRAQQQASKYVKNTISPKAVSQFVDIAGEAIKPIANFLLEEPLKSIYNEKAPYENYNEDAFSDALRSAAINGVFAGVSSAWSDAQNQVRNKAFDATALPRMQTKFRGAYIGTTKPNTEGYAALIRSLYSKKGNRRRW